MKCFFCLIRQEWLPEHDPADAITIYNGVAVCGNHLHEYAEPEWLVDRYRRESIKKRRASR